MFYRAMQVILILYITQENREGMYHTFSRNPIAHHLSQPVKNPDYHNRQRKNAIDQH